MHGIVDFHPHPDGLNYTIIGAIKKYQRCTTAHHLQAMIWSPHQSDFEGMVRSNMIVNTYLNVVDCKRSANLFDKTLTYVRGKTVQNQVEPEYVA